MDFYADLFNDVKRPVFSSSIAKNGTTAFYGRSLSIFKYVSVKGMNPGSNDTTLKA